MYVVYGCPKVLRLGPTTRSTEALSLAFNANGSLVAIATTTELLVWSGGKDHIPLGSLALLLRPLPNTPSFLWKRDSSALAAVSGAGHVVLVSVRQRPGSKPIGERFSVPNWLEQQHSAEDEDQDSWSHPADAELTVVAEVVGVDSNITAMCQGRFGQDLLVGTADGKFYGISWQGTILCRYEVVAMSGLSFQVGVGGSGSSRSRNTSSFEGVAITSMCFHDTLQVR
ncbi:unnamed protein product [Choristocarpus tenellus]